MDAAAELFLGTWRYEAQMSVGGTWTDYLHLTTQGFALWSFSAPDYNETVYKKPQLLWFKVEPSGTLHFGHPPNQPGWTREYHFDNNDRFVMSYGDKSWVHHRVAADEVPDWVAAAIDAALKE